LRYYHNVYIYVGISNFVLAFEITSMPMALQYPFTNTVTLKRSNFYLKFNSHRRNWHNYVVTVKQINYKFNFVVKFR